MRIALAVVGFAAVLAACSDKGSPRAASTTVAPLAPTTTTAAATMTSAVGGGSPAKDGCASSGAPMPAGSDTAPTVDLDGDGRDDTLWFARPSAGGARVFGVTTASGRTASAEFSTASGASTTLFAVNADERGPVELFAINRGAYLYVFADCAIQPVVDKAGQAYSFDLGFGDNGTGVGCIDADGDGWRDLVGLLDEDHGGSSDTVTWKRTIVRLDGTHATNGPSKTGVYHRPQDDAKISLLHDVTCGNGVPSDAQTVTEGG